MNHTYNPEHLKKAQTYIEMAMGLGAETALLMEPEQICWDSRTLLKCMFGCANWGKGPTCPSRPGSPTMAEYKEMFSRYKWAILIHTKTKKAGQDIALALESAAFHDGYYFAFSLFDCVQCATCAGKTGEPCHFVQMARPSFHSIGVDVFKTVHQYGLPLQTLPDRNYPDQNIYSVVFVE